MKIDSLRILLKSLIPLTLATLHHLLRQVSFKALDLHSQSLQDLSTSPDHYVAMMDSKEEALKPSQAFLWETTPSETEETSPETYMSYFWFLTIMIFLEIFILICSFTKKALGSKLLIPQQPEPKLQSSTLNILDRKESHEPWRLKECALYILKIFFVSSVSYLLYIAFFTVISFSCNLHIQKQGTFSHQELTSTEFPQSFPKIFPTNNRMLTPLDSTMGQLLPPVSISVNSMIISSDQRTAFIATNYDESGVCSMQIFNITNKDSPLLLGSTSVPFPGNITSFLPISMFFALSPDEKTLFMTTGISLEIINISNLTSPVNINSVKFDSQGTQGLALSSDGNTVALVNVANSSTGETNLKMISVRDPQSPVIIATPSLNISSSVFDISLSSVYIQKDLMFAGLQSTWKMFDISDIAHPTLLGVLNFSKITDQKIYSTIFSPDFQTAYVCRENTNESLISVDIVNISNRTDLKVIGTGNLAEVSYVNADLVTMSLSSNGRYLFNMGLFYIQIFDISNPSTPTALPQISIPLSNYVTISPDGQTAWVGNSEYFYTMQLFLDIRASQALNIQNNIIKNITIPSDDSLIGMVMSPDGSTLYIVSQDNNNNNVFMTMNITNLGSPVAIPEFQLQLQGFVDNPVISPDGKTMLIGYVDFNFNRHLAMYDIATTQQLFSFNLAGRYQLPLVSPDGNTLFIILDGPDFLCYDISNRTDPSLLSNTSYLNGSPTAATLSPDGTIALLSNSLLEIYDVSTPKSPTHITSFQGPWSSTAGITTSPDGNTAFLFVWRANVQQGSLAIIDISSLNTPTLITLLDIPSEMSDFDSDSEDFCEVPMIVQNQTLFIANGDLVIFDVSTLTAPSLIAYYLGPFGLGGAFSLAITPDQSAVIIGDSSQADQSDQGAMVLSMKPEYLLYLTSDSFPLGNAYSNSVNVLMKNSNNTYDGNLLGYKFTHFYLYSIEYEFGYSLPVPTYKALPNWISFDEGNAELIFSPNSQSQIGSHIVCGVLSTQVNSNAFIGIGHINNTNQSMSLIIDLVGLGYLDNERFLTPSFDATQSLLLEPEYMDYENEIRKKLANYSTETFTIISITTSLTVTFNNQPYSSANISANTLSLNPLNLNITLSTAANFTPQFISTGYSFIPSFSNNFSTLTMVGSLVDINAVFPQLIVFLGDLKSCNGTITLSDGLNPALVQPVSNISQYFKVNLQPQVNLLNFHSQINAISAKTGEQFGIQFASSTFTDLNNQQLTLALTTPEGELAVPSWLSLRGLYLSGIPPEELLGREVTLKIVVSNEYQFNEVEFTLSIGISLTYALKLLGTYGGGFITVIGLLIYAHSVYNILGKRFYRYPRDFHVYAEEKITTKTIYPIAFIGKELKEARLIMERIDRKIAREVKSSSKSKIAEYFVNSDVLQIDELKLVKAIETVVAENLKGSKTKLELQLYNSEVKNQKELINYLILSTLTIRLIELKQEKPTKLAFEKVKKNVFSLVDLSTPFMNGICRFSVNKARLYEELKANKINIYSVPQEKENEIELSATARNLSIHSNPDQERQKSFEKALISSDPIAPVRPKYGVNIDLLVNVIEAYAFRYHNLDADVSAADILIKKKRVNISSPRALKRFLKLDLHTIQHTTGLVGKGKIGYGIKFNVQESLLTFYGVANNNIKDETVVIQILNTRGRILREVWLNGNGAELVKQPLKDDCEEEIYNRPNNL